MKIIEGGKSVVRFLRTTENAFIGWEILQDRCSNNPTFLSVHKFVDHKLVNST